ncbi:MAG: transcription elongation factor GreA [Alphaproteobacteria bacterium]|nr:transcription elongation factor GreA [Alphaproteobacteria bacterium]
MEEKIPMTAGGYEKLSLELEKLKTIERPRIVAAIEEARGHGDLSENAEYASAREQQGFNEGRIAELESAVARAQVIDPKTLSGDKVMFGATISVSDCDAGTTYTYQIVGQYEADLEKGLISLLSPLARALIGKSAGDIVEFQTPGGIKSYEILSVRYL